MKFLFGFIFIFSFIVFISCGDDGEIEVLNESVNKDEEEQDTTEYENSEENEQKEETADDFETEDSDEYDNVEDNNDDDTEKNDDDHLPEESEMTEEDFMDEVTGRYAHYDIVAYYSEMGMTGTFKNLIISYGFTEFEKEDGKLKITDRFCHSEQITNQNFTATVPDEMTQAIVPDSTYMDIEKDENGEFYLWRPQTPTLLGIEYEDPYNTPLPESIEPDDPRLVDADNDGKPGVTVFIDMFGSTEEIHIARREIFAFEAYLLENGNIEGVVHDDSEQLTIDATSFLLKQQTGEWLQYRGENGDDYSLSPIILVPIDESYDCEKLMQERDELFPPNPPVWE